MIKTKSDHKPEIDLNGPEGNAFVLLAYARNYGKQLGLDYKQIQSEMQVGDYENLINVFDKYFGEYIDLIRRVPSVDEEEE